MLVDTRELPPPNWIDCCTDVAIGSDDAYGAAVFRDSKNRIQAIVSTRLNVTNPTLAEAKAMINAVEFAISKAFKMVCFYTDNISVVRNFNIDQTSNLSYLLEGEALKYKAFKSSFDRCTLKKINRDINYLAHNAAKWAKFHSKEGELDLSSLDERIFSDSVEWFPD